ncbi:TrmB family transcriptional regulator [Carnobacterium gallinarum]|uniref:TrmB family transcriptional regulator n=1 Tax=Carnobacterium gallinarum TaxID=2749 RepID=UPI0005536FB5|nr:TrmB family transcriptional regulator [Carnobacterium gallinarum]
MQQIVQVMKKYNFSEYETLVYTTLLEIGNLSGYETSKRSGVPRSKVYNVLESLLKKGLVIVTKTDPKLYQALSAQEFLEKLKKDALTDIDYLELELGRIKEKEEEEMLWKLDGYENVQNKAYHLICDANESLYVQIWEEELTDELIAVLTDAEKRLNEFVLILFSKNHHYELPFKRYYCHGFEAAKLEDFGSRWLNIVKDTKEVVFGTIRDSKTDVDVLWTKNKSMISLSKEYVKHDAYTLKIINQLPEPLKAEYGNAFEKIRDIY